jgi:hypothetical protein
MIKKFTPSLPTIPEEGRFFIDLKDLKDLKDSLSTILETQDNVITMPDRDGLDDIKTNKIRSASAVIELEKQHRIITEITGVAIKEKLYKLTPADGDNSADYQNLTYTSQNELLPKGTFTAIKTLKNAITKFIKIEENIEKKEQMDIKDIKTVSEFFKQAKEAGLQDLDLFRGSKTTTTTVEKIRLRLETIKTNLEKNETISEKEKEKMWNEYKILKEAINEIKYDSNKARFEDTLNLDTGHMDLTDVKYLKKTYKEIERLCAIPENITWNHTHENLETETSTSPNPEYISNIQKIREAKEMKALFEKKFPPENESFNQLEKDKTTQMNLPEEKSHFQKLKEYINNCLSVVKDLMINLVRNKARNTARDLARQGVTPPLDEGLEMITPPAGGVRRTPEEPTRGR